MFVGCIRLLSGGMPLLRFGILGMANPVLLQIATGANKLTVMPFRPFSNTAKAGGSHQLEPAVSWKTMLISTPCAAYRISIGEMSTGALNR